MNLNNNHNDPSMMRARMVWEYMRAQGYIAACISHVRLYINDEYKGLYINVEHVDEEFIQSDSNTTTATCGSAPTLPIWLTWATIQKPTNSHLGKLRNNRTYELKTNNTKDDYSAIRDLCHLGHRQRRQLSM